MTSAPASLSYEPAPRPARPYSRLIVALAWAVILSVVATTGYFNWRASRAVVRARAVNDFQLMVVSRMTVGSHYVFSRWGLWTLSMNSQSLDQVRSVAVTVEEKLRAICVVGEVQGSKAALEELDRVQPLLTNAQVKHDAAALRTIYARAPAALPAAKREELIQRHGWFAKLALSYGKPPSDPQRQAVIHSAVTTFTAFAIFELVTGLALLAGLVLLVLAIVLLALGNIRPAYERARPPTTAFLEAFAVYLVGFTAIGVIVRWARPQAGLSATWYAIPLVLFAMIWPVFRGVSWPEVRRGLGWHRGRGLFFEVFAGIGAYLAGLPFIAMAMVVSWVLITRSGAVAVHPIMFASPRGAWPIAQLYLLASVWAPLVEESMFRGALFHHLRQRHGWWLSALVSSFVFAAIHPQGWAGIPVLGAIALVFAAIREWRGTIFASAAAHAVNNGVVTTLLVVAFR